jgi:two-component system response regulator NreC
VSERARRIGVCLADDHRIVRDGLRLLIDRQPDMDVLGDVDDGDSAVALAVRLRPDVLVLDVSMPGRSGLDALPELRRIAPATRIVVLTVHEEQAYVRRLLAAGAHGYVLKRSAAGELIAAIRRIVDGESYVDSALASRLMLAEARRRSFRAADELTPRETEVVTLIARGFGNSEIAVRLGISVKTVESHRTRIMAKMHFATRADIVRYALSAGYLGSERRR